MFIDYIILVFIANVKSYTHAIIMLLSSDLVLVQLQVEGQLYSSKAEGEGPIQLT